MSAGGGGDAGPAALTAVPLERNARAAGGALTHGDDLRLAARHCLPQLGPAGADELRAEIAAALARLG